MVPQNIKVFRVASMLDQNEFAKRIGVTQPTVSSWENGKSEPTISQFLTMIDMGANINFLLYGKGNPIVRMSA